MKRKILALIVSLGLIGVQPVRAESPVWQNINVLAQLLAVCEQNGINTDYEEVNYNILKRFITYYGEDVSNGVAQDRLQYNDAYLTSLYQETKAALESYISGTQTPKSSPEKYTTGSYNISGGNIVNNEGKPYFSNGYGFFETLKNDIPVLNGFGAYNVQIEEGTKYYIEPSDGIPYWRYSIHNSMNAELTVDTSQGYESSKSLKITNATGYAANVYMQLYQDVFVKPNTTYEYGVWVKGSNVNQVWLSATGWDNRKTITANGSWVKKSFTFTTGEDTNSTTIRLVCEGITNSLWLDGFYMKETGGENVILNSGFEEETTDFFEVYPCNSRSKSLKTYLKAAEKNNVAVCLNLAPHYFPEFVYSLYPEIKGGYGLMQFNVDHPVVKAVLKAYAEAVMDVIADCPAVTGICLTNEPTFSTVRNRPYFNESFRGYLENQYGTVAKLNAGYNTTYTSFSQIEIPNSYRLQPIFYDWMNYNEIFFADWHRWFMETVKEINPDMPVYSKMMAGMASNTSAVMERGSDYTLFADWGDMMGFDGGATIYSDAGRIAHLAVQDMMASVTDKPLYNSENHIIPDGDTNYTALHARHVYNQIWQSAVHGLDASTIWVWGRTENAGSDLYGSILNRPDCLAQAAYAGMDLNRNMEIITAFQEKDREVGILYSEASNLYDTSYKENMLRVYEELLYNGVRCGFVNEERMDILPTYNTLIVPQAAYVTDLSYDAIVNFVGQGGRLILVGSDCLGYDQFKKLRDTAPLLTGAEQIALSDIKARMGDLLSDKISYRPVDAQTLSAAEKVSVEAVTFHNQDYLNICNYNAQEPRNIYILKDGKELIFYDNLITEKPQGAKITLEPLQSILLRVSDDYILGDPADINLQAVGGSGKVIISWKNKSETDFDSIAVYDGNDSPIQNTEISTEAGKVNHVVVSGLTNDIICQYTLVFVLNGVKTAYFTEAIPRNLANTYTTDGYDLSPWKFNQQAGFGVYIDHNEKYSGESSLRIAGNRLNGYFSARQDKWYGDQDAYVMTFMAKAGNVEGDYIKIYNYNGWKPELVISGNEWRSYTFYPIRGTNFNPLFVVQASCNSLWIDDIVVKKLSNGVPVGDNLALDGGFEKGVSGMMASSGDESLLISWRNPQNQFISAIDIRDEQGRSILGDAILSTDSRAVNSFAVNNLTNGKEYQYYVVFRLNGIETTIPVSGTPNKAGQTQLTENGYDMTGWTFSSSGRMISLWLDETEAYEGNSSLKIISNYIESFGSLTHHAIALDADKQYQLSFWAKTENADRKFEYCNDWSVRKEILANGKGWKNYTMQISGQSSFVLRYIFETPGILWLDHIELFEMENGVMVGQNLIAEGSFEAEGVGEVSFNRNGNMLSASIPLFNYMERDFSPQLFLAVYQQDGGLLRMTQEKPKVNKNPLPVSLSADYADGQTAKVFAWRDGGMFPLSNVAVYP